MRNQNSFKDSYLLYQLSYVEKTTTAFAIINLRVLQNNNNKTRLRIQFQYQYITISVFFCCFRIIKLLMSSSKLVMHHAQVYGLYYALLMVVVLLHHGNILLAHQVNVVGTLELRAYCQLLKIMVSNAPPSIHIFHPLRMER